MQEAAPSPPAEPPPPRYTGDLVCITSGAEAQQGRRWNMEDRHVVIEDLAKLTQIPSNKRRSFYAIFDGHGGVNSATLAYSELLNNFINDEAYARDDFSAAFTSAFDKTDKYILDRASKSRFRDGSTALAVFVDGRTMYIANAGDSEAVMGVRHHPQLRSQKSTGSGLSSTVMVRDRDFKPFSATLLTLKDMPYDEIDRIRKAGGDVISNRVMGSLAVSRSFGDIDYKAPYNGKEADFVISQPHVKRLELQPDHEILILACDGLWDVFKPIEAVEMAWRCKQEGKSAGETAVELVKAALKRGSGDNVSCIVLFLLWDVPPPPLYQLPPHKIYALIPSKIYGIIPPSPSKIYGSIPPSKVYAQVPPQATASPPLVSPSSVAPSPPPPVVAIPLAVSHPSDITSPSLPAESASRSTLLTSAAVAFRTKAALLEQEMASGTAGSSQFVKNDCSNSASQTSSQSLALSVSDPSVPTTDLRMNPALRRFLDVAHRSVSDPHLKKTIFREQTRDTSESAAERASPGRTILRRASLILTPPKPPATTGS